MKKTNGQRRGRMLLIFCAATAVLFSLLAVLVLGTALYIDTSFAHTVDEELFDVGRVPVSPKFYAYRFTDRTARLGEAVDVTDRVYAQRQNAYVPYDEIPQAMIDAFVAIEDKRFFTHEGVDWYRTLAAGANYLLGFSDTFGASTVTQQLVKNMTGESEVTPRRKLQEILYALDLERRLSKEQIMELYLNVIHFSDNCNGIVAAAEHYFSKDVRELTAAECASIAAITNSPSYYNPIRHPENNLARRNLILSEMRNDGFLSEETYRKEVSSPLSLEVDSTANTEGINPWYTDMVIEDVICDLMKEYGMSRPSASHLLYTGGLHVEMAMDEEIQSIVEEYYRTAVVLPRNREGESAQSALIVIDSRTGDILGVAGAVGAKNGNHVQNFATQTLRPPGSTIKPISVYAPALEEGLITWSSVFDDVPTDFHYEGHLVWPQNATRVYRGLTNIPYAVAHSTNTVAVRVLRRVGLNCSFAYAKGRFRLTSLAQTDCADAALALGQTGRGVTLREMTAAYTPFADAGVYHPYRSYYRVTDAEGNLLLSRTDEGEEVISRETAAIMTKLLQGVIADGTSRTITLQRVCECAGKTGTTSNDYDRWFIGYTPEIVCGVWCGYAYPEPLTDRHVSTNIWNNVMRRIVSRTGGKTEFTVPSTVIRASFCKDSGLLADEACMQDARGDRLETGWFVVGSEPKRFCDCHVLCDYDCGEGGGVYHGDFLSEERQSVGLIRVERHFPLQIYVTDAQYVYRGDPASYPINEDPTQPYFASGLSDFCGVTNVETQFNRSCTRTAETEEWEDEDIEDIEVPEWDIGSLPQWSAGANAARFPTATRRMSVDDVF
ncbi:MAG: transglycosylase domain-containing protein [Clostridia bacterium]|nr:transglycosylase domain-containing protein [Clostridia bacterium]